eukprot:458237-Pelagomonas_calceolata.AAC.11
MTCCEPVCAELPGSGTAPSFLVYLCPVIFFTCYAPVCMHGMHENKSHLSVLGSQPWRGAGKGFLPAPNLLSNLDPLAPLDGEGKGSSGGTGSGQGGYNGVSSGPCHAKGSKFNELTI